MTKDEETIVSAKVNPKFSSVFVFKSCLSHLTGRISTYGQLKRYLQK